MKRLAGPRACLPMGGFAARLRRRDRGCQPMARSGRHRGRAAAGGDAALAAGAVRLGVQRVVGQFLILRKMLPVHNYLRLRNRRLVKRSAGLIIADRKNPFDIEEAGQKEGLNLIQIIGSQIA
jgi:hypothetical protein